MYSNRYLLNSAGGGNQTNFYMLCALALVAFNCYLHFFALQKHKDSVCIGVHFLSSPTHAVPWLTVALCLPLLHLMGVFLGWHMICWCDAGSQNMFSKSSLVNCPVPLFCFPCFILLMFCLLSTNKGGKNWFRLQYGCSYCNQMDGSREVFYTAGFTSQILYCNLIRALLHLIAWAVNLQ